MGTQDSPAAQAQYPSRVKHAGDDASVPLQAEKQLWEESGRLFSDNQISVDAMRISPENHGSVPSCLKVLLAWWLMKLRIDQMPDYHLQYGSIR